MKDDGNVCIGVFLIVSYILLERNQHMYKPFALLRMVNEGKESFSTKSIKTHIQVHFALPVVVN